MITNITKLGEIYGKIPQIWKRMADSNGYVNSNYGMQWKRNDQLDKVINMLKQNPQTRQACISIYDGKEMNKYARRYSLYLCCSVYNTKQQTKYVCYDAF